MPSLSRPARSLAAHYRNGLQAVAARASASWDARDCWFSIDPTVSRLRRAVLDGYGRLIRVSTVVYHVSSTLNRNSIAEHGLDWQHMGNEPGIAGSRAAEQEGVFLSRDLDEAAWFVSMGKHHHLSIDVWEVTLRDVSISTSTRIHQICRTYSSTASPAPWTRSPPTDYDSSRRISEDSRAPPRTACKAVGARCGCRISRAVRGVA